MTTQHTIDTEIGTYLVEPYGNGWVYQPDEPLAVFPWSEIYPTAEEAVQAAQAEAWNVATEAQS